MTRTMWYLNADDRSLTRLRLYLEGSTDIQTSLIHADNSQLAFADKAGQSFRHLETAAVIADRECYPFFSEIEHHFCS